MKYLLTALIAVSVMATPALAQHKKPTKATPKGVGAKKGDGGLSRGTKQMAGGDGVFGVVYTLDNGFNFEILSVKYTLESHNDYEGTMGESDQKLVWVTFAIKNSDTRDLGWGGLNVTLVDDTNTNYSSGNSEGHTKLASQGSKSFFMTLKPGQGVGQDPVKDELSCAIPVPGKAKIVRIILNNGRKNITGEKVVRYNIAGYPSGSPTNIITPLPKYAADPTDPTGATLAVPGTVVTGKFYPAGYFAIRFDGLTTTTDPVYDKQPPEDGKVYAVATFTAKNVFSKTISTFELFAGQNDGISLQDADGDKYNVTGDAGYAARHARRDEALKSTEVEVGETVTYRYIFQIPKDTKPASLTFGQNRYGHLYKVDLTTP